jgi:hypothetical protein
MDFTGCVMAKTNLKVGDRIRIVRLPPIWSTPGYVVPISSRRVFVRLIARGRPLRIRDVDERGQAWVWWRVRRANGRVVHHGITVDDGCWVRVVPRNRRR